ncbi:hypothetical protein M404DRAFT_1001044 [Pisolithus tinctorius Marx 270]|uniref:Uncharacterized protein n=1 Tax=Pisolithus tinctorius Marx 270 TaxID=870435 RepID=A0A0C3P8S2_PISTI|nr:hypothetical protein M404DRAFT_1001044 [Pisolithus tinctorius Marx 270]
MPSSVPAGTTFQENMVELLGIRYSARSRNCELATSLMRTHHDSLPACSHFYVVQSPRNGAFYMQGTVG